MDVLKEEIDEIVRKTVLCIQPKLAHQYRVLQPKCKNHDMCFELLGFDIMIDEDMKPWLIEVNSLPSFGIESEVDHVVKTDLIRDTLSLIVLRDTDLNMKREQRHKERDLKQSGK